MVSLFGKKEEPGDIPLSPPVDIKWARNARGNFNKMMFLDTMAESLNGVSGVYLIWHVGTKPQWLYVGSTDNLAMTLDELNEDERIVDYHNQVRVLVTWAMVRPEYQDGIVRYLNEAMKPEIDNPEAERLSSGSGKVQPIAVFLPGQKPD